MARITIVIEPQLLQAARAKALQRGTSVNEICRVAVERFVSCSGDVETRLARLKVLAKKTRRSGPGTEPLWPGRAAVYAGLPQG